MTERVTRRSLNRAGGGERPAASPAPDDPCMRAVGVTTYLKKRPR